MPSGERDKAGYQEGEGGKVIRAILLVLLLVLLTPSIAHSTGHIEPVREPVKPCQSEVLTDIGEYVITAYCPCEICCGEWAKNRPNGKVYGASGKELRRGSCASPLPQGTVVLIEGVGQYTVHDTTADRIVKQYNGKIIDIYFHTHAEASRFGKHTRNVQIVEGFERVEGD